MKPILTFLAVGCAAVIVLAAVVAIGGFWFLDQKGDDLLAKGQALRENGMLSGRDLTEAQCLDQTMARSRTDKGMLSGIQQALWLDGCLETSAVEANFCDGVPPESDMRRTITWRISRCSEMLSNDSPCQNFLARVQKYCEEDVRRVKLSAIK